MNYSLSEALKYALRTGSRRVSGFIEGGNNDHQTYFDNEAEKQPRSADQFTDRDGKVHRVVGQPKGASDSQQTNFTFTPLHTGHFLVRRELGGENANYDNAILSPEALKQWHTELDQFDAQTPASKNRHRFNQPLRDHLTNLLSKEALPEEGDGPSLWQDKWDSLPEPTGSPKDLLPSEQPAEQVDSDLDDRVGWEQNRGQVPSAGDDTLPFERPPEQWGIKADDRLPWEYRSLRKALRYAAGEQEAFEKRIDENPFDADNHVIYADWLDDQGHSQEAAFRRAMGNWVRRGPADVGPFAKIEPDGASFGVYNSPDPSAEGFSHLISRYHLPEWAKGVSRIGENSETGRTLRSDPSIAYNPNKYWYHWRGYRAMEEGLRRAFNKHTQEQQ